MSTEDSKNNPSHILHDLAEERSLAYHRAVASRLEAIPEILQRARGRIERWIHERGRSVAYARRWREILDRPIADIVAVLTSEDDEARALRQCTPFAGELSPRERWKLWRDVKESLNSE